MPRTNPWDAIHKPSVGGQLTARRIDAAHHHDIYWALNEKGAYILLFKLKTLMTGVTSTPRLRGVDVEWINNPPQLMLILQNENEWEIFASLCEDLVAATRNITTCEQTVHVILHRLERWRRFLSRGTGNHLSIQQIIGLLGELTFIYDDLLPKFGPQAISFWNGPSGAPQDFAIGTTAFEVKARSTRSPSKILISSADQLWPMHPVFFLVVYPIGLSATEGRGVSLRAMVERVRAMLDQDSQIDIFEDKLVEVGYMDIPEYDDSKFEIGAPEFFQVREGFPRIELSAVPDGVTELGYAIHLDRCRPFAATVDWDAIRRG